MTGELSTSVWRAFCFAWLVCSLRNKRITYCSRFWARWGCQRAIVMYFFYFIYFFQHRELNNSHMHNTYMENMTSERTEAIFFIRSSCFLAEDDTTEWVEQSREKCWQKHWWSGLFPHIRSLSQPVLEHDGCFSYYYYCHFEMEKYSMWICF